MFRLVAFLAGGGCFVFSLRICGVCTQESRVRVRIQKRYHSASRRVDCSVFRWGGATFRRKKWSRSSPDDSGLTVLVKASACEAQARHADTCYLRPTHVETRGCFEAFRSFYRTMSSAQKKRNSTTTTSAGYWTGFTSNRQNGTNSPQHGQRAHNPRT